MGSIPLGGPNENRIFAALTVVESAAMDSNLVEVNAAAMGKGLEAEGQIALYDVLFDTDEATLKAESRVE